MSHAVSKKYETNSAVHCTSRFLASQLLFVILISCGLPCYSQVFDEVFKHQLRGQDLGFSSICDVNADGYLDVPITGLNLVLTETDFKHTSIYLNNQGNGFTESSISNIPRVIYGDCDWGDFNNDGLPDLAISGTTSGGSDYGITKVFLNHNGSFTELPVNLPGSTGGATIWFDYDNDGWQDLFIAGFDYSNHFITKIFKNNRGTSFLDTGINFGEPAGSITNLGHVNAVAADFDNDGDKDIVLAANSTLGYSIDLFENTNASFTKKQT